jgi:putative transposase
MRKTRQVILRNLRKKTITSLREGQMEAAKVWNYCVKEQLKCFKTEREWPTRSHLQKETKGLYMLHSQTVQMICKLFIGCIEQTRKNKKKDKNRKYPHKEKNFFSLLWTDQAMCIKGKKVILPMGRGRASLVLDRPEWLTEKMQSKIIWNGHEYEWHITASTNDTQKKERGINATVDLGQIHLGAVVTSDGKGLIVSGRGIRAEKRLLNKTVGQLQKKIARCQKGSKRFKRIVWSKKRFLARIKRKIRDIRHKATRQIANFCGINNVSSLFVGNPSGVQKRNSGKKHNQRMSQWEFGKDIQYIFEKAQEYGIESSKGCERGTSSTCPQCQIRKKVTGRKWQCSSCHFVGHRDLVGATNMHRKYFAKPANHPSHITYLRPGQKWIGSSRCLGTGQSEMAVAV